MKQKLTLEALNRRARGRVKRMEQEALAYKEQTVLDAEGEVARFEKILTRV